MLKDTSKCQNDDPTIRREEKIIIHLLKLKQEKAITDSTTKYAQMVVSTVS